MKRLFIHLGTQKTGSTVIQKTLYKYESDLRKEGFFLLKPTKLPFLLTFRERLDNKDYLSTIKSQFRKNINQSFNKKNKVILSWEGFYGDPLKFFKNRGQILDFISSSIGNDIEINIIVFLRRQDDFIQSLYSQAINQGQFDEGKQLLGLNYSKGFDYTLLLADLEQYLPNANHYLLPYDSAVLEKNGVVELFNEIIGSRTLTRAKTEDANIGMTSGAASLYEDVFGMIESTSGKKYLRKILQQKFNKGFFKDFNYMSFERRINLQSYYKAGNQFIANRFWKDKFGLQDFSPIREALNEENERDIDISKEVIIELVNERGEQLDKERKSLSLRIAKKINELWGI